jgi:uncharacterized RDD family membrane protein YckC
MRHPAVGIRIRSTRRRSAIGTVGSGPATPEFGRGCGSRASHHRNRGSPSRTRRRLIKPGIPPARWPGGGQAATTADGVPLSGWWWRVLAALLDGLFTGFLVSALTFRIYRSMLNQFTQLFRALTEAQRTGAPPPNLNNIISVQDQMIIVAVTLAVGVLYHGFFLRWKAATPGKLICGLRVVPVDLGHYREPLSWNSIAIRVAFWMLPSVNGLLGVVRVVDCLFPLWQPKRQALHDLAAKTQVIRPR